MMQAMGYSIEEAQGLYNGRGMLAPFDAMYSPAQKRALFEDPECGKVFRRPGLGCDEKVEVPEQDSHMFEDDKKVFHISEEHDSDEDDEVKKEKEKELELFEQHEQL